MKDSYKPLGTQGSNPSLVDTTQTLVLTLPDL